MSRLGDESSGVGGHKGTYLHAIGVEAKLGELGAKAFDPGPGPIDAVKVFTGFVVAAEDQDLLCTGLEGTENMNRVNPAGTRHGHDGYVG